MKAYTDLEQSKKLAEILPLESADMFYADLLVDGVHKYNLHPLESYGFKTFEDTKLKASDHLGFVPCWSLAALLDVLPYPSLHKTWSGWRCDSHDKEGKVYKFGESADNQIDACVDAIIKLHEQKLL